MKKIKLNLQISEASHLSGTTISSPLYISDIISINKTAKQLANGVYAAINKELLQKGAYGSLLKFIVDNELIHEKTEVTFEASHFQLFPELTLAFDFFYLENINEQFIGFVPALSIESYGRTVEELKENINENIKLEFIRKKRLHSVQSIIASQWYKEVNLQSVPVEFTFYTLSELEEIQKQKEQNLLPEVSTRLTIDPKSLFGLDKELEQLLTSMKGRYKESVLINASSGKGKTALIKAFNSVKSAHGLRDTSIWEVSAAQLLHRLSGFGSWEEYLADLCNELRKSGDILYVTNFAELFEVGQYVGNNMSMADYLRDYISRGDITLLSECTPEEAAQIELRSPGYLSIFTTIKIEEKESDQILEIVTKKVIQLAEKKSALVDESAIKETLRLQQWYTPYSGMPGKTIHFLSAIISDQQRKEEKVIEKPEIYERFCQETGMPEFMINPDIPLEYEKMSKFFHENIYGQEAAITTIMDVLVSIKAAVIRRGKPLASLLFAGPTGVGKTEMAKVLAQFMFGNRGKMIRFDMSEYADYHSILRLTGDLTQGDGLLTAAVRQSPFSVILFDELEKVNPAFYDLLLQILGEGRLTDSRGRVADFCSTIIIMTSNIGARSFQSGSIGFVETKNEREEATSHFKSAVQAHFRPELFNRLDRVIAFAPLDQAIVRNIINREMDLVKKREGIKGRNLHLILEEDVLDKLSQKGYSKTYGARFLQRVLQEKLIVPLSEKLNHFEYTYPLEIKISLKDEELDFLFTKREETHIQEQKIGDKGLRVIEFINHVTFFRRQALTVEGGNYYARFMSRLDQLERKLNKLKKAQKESKFWQDEAQSKTYYELKEINERFSSSVNEIQELESDNLLLLNHLKDDPEQIHQRFLNWKKEFIQIKTQLVKIENPELSKCTLAIYGNAEILPTILDIYTTVIKKLGYEISIHTVAINHNDKKYKKEEYKKKTGFPEGLCGLELFFKGDLSYLFFKGEGGLHKWTNKTGGDYQFKILVQAIVYKEYKTPEIVHRKNFFLNSGLRREYKPGVLKDFHYNITREGDEFSDILMNIINQQFYRNVNSYLLG